MKSCIISILLILIFNSTFGQTNEIKQDINFFLIYGDLIGNPTEGLNITDTNKIVSIIIQWNANQDTNFLRYDKFGKIDYIRTKFEESYIYYSKNGITKKTYPYYPTTVGWISDSLIYSYKYNEDNLIGSMTMYWEKDLERQFNFKYLKLPIGQLVEMYEHDNLIRRNLFLFNDDNNYFQWQIIIDENVFFKFKRDDFGIITCFENDTKYKYVEIENITFKDIKSKSVLGNYPDQYALFDASGNVIGTINVKRENITDK